MMSIFKGEDSERGLTLVELLIVIALVAVVAAIALPVISGVLSNAQNDASAVSDTNRADFARDWSAAGATFETDSQYV